MRRTAAGLAATIATVLAIGGPLATTGEAQAATLRCATATPPAACAVLDDLAARLGPVAPVLGTALAPLTGPAKAFAARSDSPAGAPVAQVVATSEDLLDALDTLPAPVAQALGPAQLGGLTSTLEALVAELTAPVTGGSQASGTSQPTPARTTTPAGSSTGTGSTAAAGSTKSGASSPSSATVPAVPVGDPLHLAPLPIPEFKLYDPSRMVPATPSPVPAEVAPAASYDEAVAALAQDEGGAELAVAGLLSVLLLGGAVAAQRYQQRQNVILDD